MTDPHRDPGHVCPEPAAPAPPKEVDPNARLVRDIIGVTAMTVIGLLVIGWQWGAMSTPLATCSIIALVIACFGALFVIGVRDGNARS